jgi:hypothetical protein
MSVVNASAIAQSIANIAQVERTLAPPKELKQSPREVRRVVTDRVEFVDTTEATDAVKGLAASNEEDAREDSQERGPADTTPDSSEPLHLDIQG